MRRDALVLLVCLGAYTLGGERPYSNDLTGTEYTALSIASGRGTSLDGYEELTQDGLPYFVVETPHGFRSSYPLGPALLAWPIFLTAPFSSAPRRELVDILGTRAAIGIALASVWLVLGIAKRLRSPTSPHLLALAYGLGTSHWSTSASALWQHGPGEVWILGAMDRLLDEETAFRRRLLALGACLALAVFTRPPHALSVLVLAVFAALRYRAKAVWAFVAAGVVTLPLLAYNLETYGSVVGSYTTQAAYLSWKAPGVWLRTLAALLSSPSRGVLWYEPVVAVGLAAGCARVFSVRSAPLVIGLAGSGALLCLYGFWSIWWGGFSFGPRFLTDLLPFWLLAATTLALPKPAVVALTLWGAVVNLLGATARPVRWDTRPSVDLFTDRLRTWGDSQLLFGFLAPTTIREALSAEESGQDRRALQLWEEEWRARPWHRYAALRIADLKLRTDDLEGALAHVEGARARWPDSLYLEHLALRLPDVRRFLENARPTEARAGTGSADAGRALDGRLSTAWSTVRPQKAGDWIELSLDPQVAVRGVVLISVPEFGAGPSGLDVVGTSTSGEARLMATLPTLEASQKGWVAVRFEPARLARIRLTVRGRSEYPWIVSEARVLF